MSDTADPSLSIAELRSLAEAAAERGRTHRGPCVLASGNGLAAVERAWWTIHNHPASDPLLAARAAVEGCVVLEDDPEDVSVGYGGLPNAAGFVECDACVMDARTHAVGAVAALRDIRHASRVALEVLQHSKHSMLVGEGALDFALAHGFTRENMLTDASRAAWEQWKAAKGEETRLSDEDRWKRSAPRDTHGDGPQLGHRGLDDAPPGVPHTTGTVHVAVRTAAEHLAACTSTSGLSWKHPGRVGDSPIVGAGIFVDDAGTAGATGRGESALDNCTARDIVAHMEQGLDPTDACRRALERMVSRTRHPQLLDDRGRPRFNVTVYALRADGAYGSACLWSGYRFAVRDSRDHAARVEPASFLFERPT